LVDGEITDEEREITRQELASETFSSIRGRGHFRDRVSTAPAYVVEGRIASGFIEREEAERLIGGLGEDNANRLLSLFESSDLSIEEIERFSDYADGGRVVSIGPSSIRGDTLGEQIESTAQIIYNKNFDELSERQRRDVIRTRN